MRLPQVISGLLLAALIAFPVVTCADEAPPVQVDLMYASKHVFRGIERAADSVQAAVRLNRENLHAALGTNQSFGKNGTDEVNLSAGYTWQAADGLALEASANHGWFDRVPGGGVDRSLEAGLKATLAPAGGFTPSLAYYHDFRFRADTLHASFARSIALPKWGAFLELNLFAGHVTGRDWRPDAAGPERRDDYGYWGGEVSLPYRIGAHSTIIAGLHYADSSGRSLTNGPFGRDSRGNFWVTLGVNLDF